MRRRIVTGLVLLFMLSCGAQAATLCVNAPGVVVLADDRGAEKTENGRFESAFVVREGALFAAGRKGAYSLFDAEGQPVGDAQFSMIDDNGQTLLFSSGHLYGAMSAEGEILLEPRWTQLTPDGMGGWLALTGDPLDEHADEIIHIDGAGAEKQTGVYCAGGLSRVFDGRMPFMDADGRYGALDAGGSVVVSPVWQYMGAYSNGLAKVVGPEGMGLIDISGRTVIAPTLLWLERSTAMIAAWDGTNLYVGVLVTNFRLANFTEGTEWGVDDGVEVIVAGKTFRAYACGKFDATAFPGGVSAHAGRRKGWKPWDWSKPLVYEVSIPFAALGVKPALGAKLPFNAHVHNGEFGEDRWWEPPCPFQDGTVPQPTLMLK